jgi:hypothetical protein
MNVQVAKPNTVTRDTIASMEGARSLGKLSSGVDVLAVLTPDGWGIAIAAGDRILFSQARPARIETSMGADVTHAAVAYRNFEGDGTAEATLEHDGVRYEFRDAWSIAEGILSLQRTVRVNGEAEGGFLSAITLPLNEPRTWLDVDAFVPGMIYGDINTLNVEAIGGAASYLTGVRQVRIRSDRMPVPMMAFNLRDGQSLTLLHADIKGTTTLADADALDAGTMVDDQFAFSAIGCETDDDGIGLGFWYPGTEGEVSYKGNTFPGGQFRGWRRRYHPIRQGFEHSYELKFRSGAGERMQETVRNSWRWGWQVMSPRLAPHDPSVILKSVTGALADAVVVKEKWAGVPIVVNSVTGEATKRVSVFGFCGRAIETGFYMLRGAEDDAGNEARFHDLGVRILDSYAKLDNSPPLYEGFDLDTGEGRSHTHTGSRVYTRCLGEAGRYMLWAWQREMDRGFDHREWRTWAEELGAWLLGEMRPNGSWPRSRTDGPNGVPDLERNASHEVVPFFVLLSQLTGNSSYMEAARRAAEFSWANGQNKGLFVGGTIDNPNVVDKEGGTLSLDAYLSLYEATGEDVWLRRSIEAGNFSETWIYLWNVPAPAGADWSKLGFKPEASTVGMQLIATGHSLTDPYMAWDVASYAKLYAYTSDAHYLDVAKLLMHNTKSMTAIPGREYDLAGPGWVQEHWSFAPRRGNGMHRHWLPWVACSQVEGIYRTRDFDSALYNEIATATSL